MMTKDVLVVHYISVMKIGILLSIYCSGMGTALGYGASHVALVTRILIVMSVSTASDVSVDSL
jgi:hypothetical protein